MMLTNETSSSMFDQFNKQPKQVFNNNNNNTFFRKTVGQVSSSFDTFDLYKKQVTWNVKTVLMEALKPPTHPPQPNPNISGEGVKVSLGKVGGSPKPNLAKPDNLPP